MPELIAGTMAKPSGFHAVRSARVLALAGLLGAGVVLATSGHEALPIRDEDKAKLRVPPCAGGCLVPHASVEVEKRFALLRVSQPTVWQLNCAREDIGLLAGRNDELVIEIIRCPSQVCFSSNKAVEQLQLANQPLDCRWNGTVVLDTVSCSYLTNCTSDGCIDYGDIEPRSLGLIESSAGYVCAPAALEGRPKAEAERAQQSDEGHRAERRLKECPSRALLSRVADIPLYAQIGFVVVFGGPAIGLVGFGAGWLFGNGTGWRSWRTGLAGLILGWTACTAALLGAGWVITCADRYREYRERQADSAPSHTGLARDEAVSIRGLRSVASIGVCEARIGSRPVRATLHLHHQSQARNRVHAALHRLTAAQEAA